MSRHCGLWGGLGGRLLLGWLWLVLRGCCWSLGLSSRCCLRRWLGLVPRLLRYGPLRDWARWRSRLVLDRPRHRPWVLRRWFCRCSRSICLIRHCSGLWCLTGLALRGRFLRWLGLGLRTHRPLLGLGLSGWLRASLSYFGRLSLRPLGNLSRALPRRVRLLRRWLLHDLPRRASWLRRRLLGNLSRRVRRLRRRLLHDLSLWLRLGTCGIHLLRRGLGCWVLWLLRGRFLGRLRLWS